MNTYIDYIASARGTAHAKMSAKTQQPQECQDESHEMLPVGAQDLARRFCTLEKCSIGVPCADGYTTRVVHARRMSASVQFRAAHVNKWATKKWASKLADQHKALQEANEAEIAIARGTANADDFDLIEQDDLCEDEVALMGFASGEKVKEITGGLQ